MFSGVKSFVDDVRHSRQPKFNGTTDTDFLKSVMDKVGQFFLYEKSAGANQATVKLTGKDVVKATMSDLGRKRVAEEKIELRELNNLKVYAWLLEPNELKQVDDWIQECVQADIVGAADRAVGKVEEEKKHHKRAGRKTTTPSARDAVLKLLS